MLWFVASASLQLFYPFILKPIFIFMKNLLTRPLFHVALLATSVGGMLAWSGQHNTLEASSHREAPLIADDPLADNTDLYAFRSPDDPTTVTIIANYIPFELPQGGPNYNTFGENVRYEIHIKNKVDLANPNSAVNTTDDFTYRFTFTRTSEDPSTFFNIRLGKQNLKTTYICEQSIGGAAFTTIVANGVVPPPNVGPRSISQTSPAVGLGTPYNTLMTNAIQTVAAAAGGNFKIFCGPVDDPFFADLGGIFDLGGIRPPGAARDGLARKNCHAIVMQIPIATLSKNGQPASAAANILDPNYIIGVWASASRPMLRTLNGTAPAAGQPFVGQTFSGNYVQVSRIGMPLTNEVVQPIGLKDEWNAGSPYGLVAKFDAGAKNPELGLYMADNAPSGTTAPKPAGQTYYGEAIPGLGSLRIQSKSLAGTPGLPAAGFDFRNGAPGLFPLKGSGAVAGTALDDAVFGNYLLQSAQPRSVDLLPIFHTGVPNLPPYQLATGKAVFAGSTVANPLTAGKPFINNFLPTFGDMLRLNMAVPVTPRTLASGALNPDFSSEGLLAAAVLGLTNPTYNASNALQSIPNMDGFPNGRRLEDDVTRIELQAVGGVVLAAIGLWYDDYTPSSASPVTAQLGRVLNFSAGVNANDTTFKAVYPFVQTPWSGTNAQRIALAQRSSLGLSPNLTAAQAYPNPFVDRTTLRFELPAKGEMSLIVSDMVGRKIATLAKDKNFATGLNEVSWQPGREVAPGQYIVTLYSGKTVIQSVRVERH